MIGSARRNRVGAGAVHSGETVCGGLRARLREVLGAEVGDLAFHTAIEDEPRPEGNHVTLVFDTSLVGGDDVEVVSRSDLWEAVWIRWDDIQDTDLYPPLVRRRLPVGTLRDEAWWPPELSSAPNDGEGCPQPCWRIRAEINYGGLTPSHLVGLVCRSGHTR
ncbi:hypothetical protein [Amycolatopsis dongchuanensis]|uniref:Uncharacterized protein n=1 Tax=Amycolatopsis dongchuanensis TaxID=1070866 RepID=A0ABP8VC44_9PSEU